MRADVIADHVACRLIEGIPSYDIGRLEEPTEEEELLLQEIEARIQTGEMPCNTRYPLLNIDMKPKKQVDA